MHLGPGEHGMVRPGGFQNPIPTAGHVCLCLIRLWSLGLLGANGSRPEAAYASGWGLLGPWWGLETGAQPCTGRARRLGVGMPRAEAGQWGRRMHRWAGDGCEHAGNSGGVRGPQSQWMGSVSPMLRLRTWANEGQTWGPTVSRERQGGQLCREQSGGAADASESPDCMISVARRCCNSGLLLTKTLGCKDGVRD